MPTATENASVNSTLTLDEEPFHPPVDDEGNEALEAEQEAAEFEAEQEADEEPETDPRLAKALELNARVMKARGEYEAAAEAAKSKKKAWEAYSEGLSEYLASLVEELPLFDKKPEAPKDEPTIEPPADGWQDVMLAEIDGMPVAAVGKLAEKEIVTLGQLAAHTQKLQLTDIKGIGPEAAEKIENALAGFWKRWGAKQAEQTDGESSESETPQS